LIDFAMGLEQRAEFRFCGAVWEVANKKFLHEIPFPVSQRGRQISSAGLVSESRRNAGYAVQWRAFFPQLN
jgi:hypothetical protein